MTKRTLWYVGLIAICCLTLVFVVQAAGKGTPRPVTTGNAAAPAISVQAQAPATMPVTPPVAVRQSVASTALNPALTPATEPSAEQVQKIEMSRALERIERGDARPGDKELVTPYFESMQGRESGNPLDAQGGPDPFGYRWVDNQAPDTVVYSWIELCADPLATIGPTGDDGTQLVNLGFSFSYYGTNYTSGYLSTNGMLQFGTANSSWSNTCISATNTNNAIYAHWDDMDYVAGTPGTCANDVIYWRSFGTYAVFEWHRDVAGYATGADVELILFDNGRVKVQWHATENTNSGSSATVACEAAGANGIQYSCNTAFSPSGKAVVFYPGAASPGRCCYGDPMAPSCVDNLPAECAALSGTWTGGLTCAANPCPACADFSLTAPGTVSGDITGAGDNCGFRAGVDQIVAVTIPNPGVWIFSLCPGFGWDTYLFLSSGCCSGQLAFNDDFCGLTSQITYNIPAAGTYFIDVEPYGAATGQWTLVVSEAPPPPANDNCADAFIIPSLPYTNSANNSGATNDCGLLGWAEVWYTFTTAEVCDIYVTYCGSLWPTPNAGLWLLNECPCATYVQATSYENTSCGDGNYSVRWSGLPAGTYWIPVYSAGTTVGDYTINVSCVPYVPCDVVSTGTPEGEDCTDPDDYNGGCNSTPNIFQDIPCDAHIAGTSYFDGSTRDTDWYQIVSLTDNEFTMTVTAEFDLQILIITPNPDCSNISYVFATGFPCDVVTLSSGPVPPGTYWFWVGPQFTTTFACGEYDMTISSVTPCTCDPVSDLTVYRQTGPANGVQLRWNANQTFGLYRVFGTTQPNNDGDPDNGADPQWTLLSDVPAPAVPGFVTYNHTPLASYVNYVVVHDCAPRGRCCYGDPMSPSCLSPVTEEECDALAGSFDEGLNCTDNPCTPCADFTLTAPGTISGSTIGAGDDCIANAGEEQVVAVTIPTDGQWTFSLCGGGTDYDSWLDLATTCCGTPIFSNDDYCGLQSELHCVQLTAGVYYLAVEGFSTATGAWSLAVSFCEPPPPLECPPEGIMENEPVCGDEYVDATNGGCNSTPNVFQPIACGQTICGESGTYLYTGLNYRDTDWFELTITEPMNVTWSVQSSFDLLIFTIGGPCPGTIRMQGNAAPMGVATVTDYMTPGTYWLWVGPSVFTGIPCGADWVGTVTCVPAGGVYCPASHSSGCDEWIGTVQLNTINNASGCGTSPYYTDYTAISTTLATGQSYAMTVLNGGSIYTSDAVSVWIDWNNNYVLNDAGEQVDLTSDGTGASFTGNIVAGAVGTHRMRVRMGWSWVPDPCGGTSYGETEDYTVVVQ